MSVSEILLSDGQNRLQVVPPVPVPDTQTVETEKQHGELVIMDPDDFFHRHYPRLYAAARRILRDRELAKDAVQDAFKNIFRFLREFRGDSRLETWMTRITVNVCLGYLRKNRTQPEEEPPLEQEGEHRYPEHYFTDTNPDPLTETYRHEIGMLLREALSGLKKIHREVILMHDFREKTLEEISASLALPIGTVKSRLFYGRKEMRQALERLAPSLCLN